MDQRTDCLICTENETNIICSHCISEYHLTCLANNYRNGTSLNRICCLHCRRQYSDDIINAIENHEINNSTLGGTIFGGIIICMAIGFCIITLGGLFSSSSNSRKKDN